MTGKTQTRSGFLTLLLCMTALAGPVLLGSCASSDMPHPAKTEVPPAERPDNKFSSINHADMPVVYVKLDDDILRPVKKSASEGVLPKYNVGPFELRDETLAAALELVIGDKKIPMSFQTNQAMTRTVTMTGLEGPVDEVVDKLCSGADLYCSFEGGTIVIKDTETFSVSLPPFITDNYDPFVNGIKAITGGQTYVDGLTRTLVYTTTHRNHLRASEYFERLRANTAMIVYEMQIWEVTLNDNNQLGIDWENFTINAGKFAFALARDGSPAITGGLGVGSQFTGSNVSVDAVINFLRTQGALKTISQPQLTVLSGSSAKLRVGNSRDYVSQITRTVGISTADNVSVTTSKLETGLNLDISSAWDNSTVYGDLKITLQNLIRLGTLDVGTTSIQLPETSDRSIETKLRVRPGDSVIIAGLLEERNELAQEGPPGLKNKPAFLTSKTNSGANTELVFMLRPRVVVYTDNPPVNAQLSLAPVTGEIPRTFQAPAPLAYETADVPPPAPPAPATPPPQAGPLKPMPLAEETLKPMPLTTPPLSDYLDQLPQDDIAPAP